MPEGVASGYAMDGTEAHELLEYALVNQYFNAHEAKIMSGFAWTHRHDNEETRLESVQDALDVINDQLAAYASPTTIVYLECQFVFPTYDNDDCGGTSDVTIYVPDLDIMVVIDYKHGSGVAVTARENTQGLTYAVGSRQELRRNGMCNSGRTVYRIIIIQPRAWHKEGPLREWVCDDARLDQHIIEVNDAIRKSKEPAPEIVPGPYCRWCPAVSACPEAEQWRMRAILPTYNDTSSLRKTGLPPVAELSVERISEILDMADMVTEWLKAVQSQAVELAKKGVAIPGRKLVLAQAKSKWNATDESGQRVIAGHLASLSGLPPHVFYRPKLVSITEAKANVRETIYQRVGKGTQSKKLVEAANKAIAELTTKDTSGNVVLVSRDDKRPELNLAQLITYHQSDDNEDMQT